MDPSQDEVEMALHESRAEHARFEDARSAALVSAHLSFCGQLKRLKPWTACGLVCLVGVVTLMASWHWQLLLATLLLLAPTLGQLLRWWQQHPEYCPLDHVLASYTHGLFVLGVLAMATAFIVSALVVIIVTPLLSLFFLHESTVLVGLILFETARWSSFCFVEELWLLSTLRRFKLKRQHRVGGEGSARAQRAYVLYASASAVGYATAQCILLTVNLTAKLQGHTVFETEAEQENAKGDDITPHETLALTGLALAFAWFWLPLRLVASHLNVLELARRPENTAEGSLCLPLPRDFAQTSFATRVAHKERFDHLVAIIKWSWGLRTIHLIQFYTWAFILATPPTTINVASWLVTTFVCWLFLIFLAVWRVRVVEREIEPSGEAAVTSAANLRELYGFSLLDDSPADAGGNENDTQDDDDRREATPNGPRETPLV